MHILVSGGQTGYPSPNMSRTSLLLLLTAAVSFAQTNVQSGKKYPRIVIRGAMVVDGSGTPASGPKDIVIENNMIAEVVSVDAMASGRGGHRPVGDIVIDAKGKYVLPGLIDAHAHVQDERGGVAQPLDYELKIWLACGITTVRDVGSDTKKTLELRRKSAEGSVASPRIFVYPMFGAPKTPELARARVRELHALTADGIKFTGINRDIMEAAEDEAHKLGMRIAHHVGVEETNAWDDIRLGTTSIEHWYGIPDAALDDGVQHFPSNYNYSNEGDRFRYGGRLFREANPEALLEVLDAMVDANVAWTSTDEAYWKENYRLWMAALRDFDKKGGLIGVGDDAGFLYSLYGFGLIRELELQQEAGFPTLKVIQHATSNNARILGQEAKLGKVRAGYTADLIVVNGNPVEDLKVLYPTGIETWVDGKPIHGGAVEWTIKDGIPYHGPTLLNEVKEMVAKARAERK